MIRWNKRNDVWCTMVVLYNGRFDVNGENNLDLLMHMGLHKFWYLVVVQSSKRNMLHNDKVKFMVLNKTYCHTCLFYPQILFRGFLSVIVCQPYCCICLLTSTSKYWLALLYIYNGKYMLHIECYCWSLLLLRLLCCFMFARAISF